MRLRIYSIVLLLELMRVDYFNSSFWHHVRDDNLIRCDVKNMNKHFWRRCWGYLNQFIRIF
jgi:hypothetical protein